MRSKCRAGRAASLCPRARTCRRDGEDGDGRRTRAPPGKPAKIAAPERVAAFRTGLSAESFAAAYLIAKGYRILARRFRTPHGEIDIVARRRNLVAFVEVKARARLDEAAYAVTPRQQPRIIAAAEAWLMAHPEHGEYRTAFRRHADCAETSAAPSVSGIRRQHLTPPCPAINPDPPNEIERRRPDGPDRAHQHSRRFDLRAVAGSAKARPRLSYYTPDKLSLRGEELVAPVQLLTVRDEDGNHFTLGEPRREPLIAFDVILLRQDPPFDLAYITSTHLLERIHPKTLVVNDPASVRNAPEKIFVTGFSAADAADADLARPRRDQRLSRPARRGRDEAAARPWRRRRVPRSCRRT